MADNNVLFSTLLAPIASLIEYVGMSFVIAISKEDVIISTLWTLLPPDEGV